MTLSTDIYSGYRSPTFEHPGPEVKRKKHDAVNVNVNVNVAIERTNIHVLFT